jgi:hypothetical protein
VNVKLYLLKRKTSLAHDKILRILLYGQGVILPSGDSNLIDRHHRGFDSKRPASALTELSTVSSHGSE